MSQITIGYALKALLGFVCVVPLTYLCVFFAFIAYATIAMPMWIDETLARSLFLTHLSVSVLNLMLLVGFVIHACRNSQIQLREMIQWIVLFVILSFVTIPVYWYLHIWRSNDDGARFREHASE